MRNSGQNMILGACSGYTWEQLRPFVVSWQGRANGAQLVLFGQDVHPGARRELESRGARLAPYDGRGVSHEGAALLRFFVYREFLESLRHAPPECICLTDVRDVVFQADPFQGLEHRELCFFLEDRPQTIGANTLNRHWIMKTYGLKTLKRMGECTVSCVGTCIGRYESLLRYVREMTEEMKRLPLFWGLDQAVHNRIVHEGLFPEAEVFENPSRHVIQMALMPREVIHVNASGRVATPEGEEVALVHQYDRHEDLCERLFKSLGVE